MLTPSYNISSACCLKLLMFLCQSILSSAFIFLGWTIQALSACPLLLPLITLVTFLCTFSHWNSFLKKKNDPQKYFYRFLMVWAPVVLFVTFRVGDFCCGLCVLFVCFQLIEYLLWFNSNSFGYTCNSTWYLFCQFHNSPNVHCSLTNEA